MKRFPSTLTFALAALTACLTLGPTASAAIIAEYGPNATNDPNVINIENSAAPAPNVTVSNMTEVGGFEPNDRLQEIAGGIEWKFSNEVATSEDGALTSAQSGGGIGYATFTLTPSVPFGIEFQSLDFTHGELNFLDEDDPDTINSTIFLQTSVDGFGSGKTVDSHTHTSGTPADSVSFDLTGLGLQTTPVEFRLYAHDDNSVDVGTRFRARASNITLNATVIPEPASLALLAIGGLTVLTRRRGVAMV